ncbi:hypothetical protein CQ14_04840 [Bradyrhizobium lablabi]|uniref:Uncharacterized protein n=1 Tax=Bradyrhizobium lablabi TaxID=722472 RepID=A0A0R3MXD6_9BRAD|nr:hypothetical protein CQ14_04840 [Bradyrhizobium lablabi]
MLFGVAGAAEVAVVAVAAEFGVAAVVARGAAAAAHAGDGAAGAEFYDLADNPANAVRAVPPAEGGDILRAWDQNWRGCTPFGPQAVPCLSKYYFSASVS